MERNVPLVVIKRLPRYYRYLGDLLNNNIYRISSTDLSRKMNVTASQIRQDLNYFGGFGQLGYGYNVEALYNNIGAILGLSKGYKTFIVGSGNLGSAIANYPGFKKRGFNLCGMFDIDKSKIGTKVCDILVQDYNDIESFIKEENPDIAILALPKGGVSDVANHLVKCGIKAFWNFAYVDLELPNDVLVENVHLIDSLMSLSFKKTNLQK